MNSNRQLFKGDRTPFLMDEISIKNAHLIEKSINKISKTKQFCKGKKMNLKEK